MSNDLSTIVFHANTDSAASKGTNMRLGVGLQDSTPIVADEGGYGKSLYIHRPTNSATALLVILTI